MSEKAMIDWIEFAGAQVWRDRHSGNWTVQVMTGGIVIQPTRATLRAAICDACMAWSDAK